MSFPYGMRPSAWLPMRSMPTEIHAWMRAARETLGHLDPNDSLELQTLVGFVLEKPRSWVLAHPESLLNDSQLNTLERLLGRLVKGEPLAYLTEQKEFYGLGFWVNRDVLVPRPETELLVELGLNWLQAHPGRRKAVDVGTGSGCIAAALAYHVPDLQVTAVDFSRPALRVARKNIKSLGLSERVRLVQADLLSGVTGRFDLICANLPYIPTGLFQSLAVADHEPRLALDGGKDGLVLIQRLIKSVRPHLNAGGLLLLEIEAGQGERVPMIARKALPGAEVGLIHDLTGKGRVVRVEDRS